jgi:hypothetical protein
MVFQKCRYDNSDSIFDIENGHGIRISSNDYDLDGYDTNLYNDNFS